MTRINIFRAHAFEGVLRQDRDTEYSNTRLLYVAMNRERAWTLGMHEQTGWHRVVLPLFLPKVCALQKGRPRGADVVLRRAGEPRAGGAEP